jgi:hypothetical protein
LVWAGQKIGDNIFQARQIQNLHINSEINVKWHCCLGEMGAETQEMAVTSDL